LLHTIQIVLLVAPVLLFSVIAHEIAHGYAALRQGDRTALEAGRLTWNPAKHIDPFLTLLLPLMMLAGSYIAGGRAIVLGGAKPVPVDPRNYRHPRLGDILVSLAGVAANLLIGVLCALLIAVLGLAGHALPAPDHGLLHSTLGILQAMFVFGIWLNAGLIAFNLLPIPPLDGSHVFKYLLPRPLAVAYVRFARYGLLVLLLLLFIGEPVLQWWLSPAIDAAQGAVDLVGRYLLPSAAQWLQ
jgi:Zn-dependent protease